MALTTFGAVRRESLGGFLGVNLRRDTLSLADEDLVRALNLDLHRTPGVLRVRAGRSVHGRLQADTSAVRTIARHGTVRYQVGATQLYRDYRLILNGLDATKQLTTLVPSRPLNDATTWTFVADQALMRKDNGADLRIWGIVAPAAAPTLATGAAGSLTGAYRARYTYARVVGSAVAHESNPCPIPSPVTLAAQQLNVPVVASADPQVTHIRVYRTLTGGTSYFFDQQVANTTATIASSQADSALGTAIETDNNTPPLAAWATEFQAHLFLCVDAANPHYLWYSKRFRPESWPTAQFLELGNPTDPLQCSVALTGILGVFSRETKYRVLGNSVSGFVGVEALSTRGTVAANAVALTSRGVLFVARDGLFLTNFQEGDTEISQAIQSLFYGETVNELAPIDWSVPQALTMAEYKRRLYFGYVDTSGIRILAIYSLDTQRWYHYLHPVHRLYVEEADDRLLMGTTDGAVAILETGTTDETAAGAAPVAVVADFPRRSLGDPYQPKRLQWLGVDVEDDGGSGWDIGLVVDETLAQSVTVTGSRRRRYTRLPVTAEGRTWHAQARRSGSNGLAALYGIEVIEDDPHSGQVWVAPSTEPTSYVQLLPGVPGDTTAQQAYGWLLFEAATGVGEWTVRVVLDEVVAHTASFLATREQTMVRLPNLAYGHVWRAEVEYLGDPVPQVYRVRLSAEDTTSGQVWVLDPGNPEVVVQRLPGQPIDGIPLHRWEYLRFDASPSAGTWALQVYINEVLRTTVTLPGRRDQTAHRLPPQLLGHRWRIVARYTGTGSPVVYAASLLGTPLRTT
jgi:hypothetical protein